MSIATALAHTADAVLGTDTERLAKRRELRKQIAKLKTIVDRGHAINAEIRKLDDRAEQAAADHQATC